MNRKMLLAIVIVVALQLGVVSSAATVRVPSAEQDPMDHLHHLTSSLVGDAPALAESPLPGTDIGVRYIPRPAGVEKDMNFYFGPFTVPPGQDINRVTVDIPIHEGFVTAIAPELIDVATGQTPPDLDMHIHHAHWFRASSDPGDEYYTANLAWVFGTGEEKTQGSFNDRSAAEPGGPRYGIFMPGAQPQAMIFMLHNKLAVEVNMYILLKVSFVYGTAAQIAGATGCGDLDVSQGEICSAGANFHEVKGRLWGSTFDVPRHAIGDGIYIHPQDIPAGDGTRRPTDDLGRMFAAPYGGTLIASAGHMHPNGREVVVANLGPAGSGCEADLDNDGLPGTTLFRSTKINRYPVAGTRSEEFQMGATKLGFRAPIRLGDRLTQFAIYENGAHASYAAMSYVGVYVDRQQVPAPLGEGGCTAANMGSYLVNDPLGDPTETILNHAWRMDVAMPYCGPGFPNPCDRPAADKGEGLETNIVHVAAFAYLPGDLNVDGVLGAPPKVKQGESITFVSEDVAGNIRHTITSCEWPCNGPYTGNYPQPDGLFDSGKLGNLDYIDGGIVGSDTTPIWQSPTTLEPGLYSYFCRIHPAMRGAFEVVA